jgi:hypothetical protein
MTQRAFRLQPADPGAPAAPDTPDWLDLFNDSLDAPATPQALADLARRVREKQNPGSAPLAPPADGNALTEAFDALWPKDGPRASLVADRAAAEAAAPSSLLAALELEKLAAAIGRPPVKAHEAALAAAEAAAALRRDVINALTVDTVIWPPRFADRPVRRATQGLPRRAPDMAAQRAASDALDGFLGLHLPFVPRAGSHL